MADSNNNIHTNIPAKGLILDYSEMSNSKEVWIYARNVTINSQNGNIVSLQNEPATLECCSFPYTYIGNIPLKNNRYAIFSTDNTNSEIGIFEENTCIYTPLVNNTCLGFNTSNLIFGAAKESFDGSEIIHWADGQLNEMRYLNLDKIPYTYNTTNDSCKTKVYTTNLDCNEISFTKKFSIPCIKINAHNYGTFKNGSYQCAIAYSNNGQRLTDIFSVTGPESIWTHKGNSGGLEVTISNLDLDFNTYQLYLIQTINNVTTYAIVGEYSTSENKHTLVVNDSPSYTQVPAEEISVKKVYYQKADYMVANDQHLFISGLSTRPKVNYQLKALGIKAKYIVTEVPVDYYKTNNKVGNYRNEVYSYSIQGVYTDGETTDLFHIKGRDASDSDKATVYGKDVFETTVDCLSVKENKRYQVYNTASRERKKIANADCLERVVAEGDMAYWESTDLYPDNKEMFGDYACKPIQHHKFPDEEKSPRYRKDSNGKIFLRILGIQFYDIPEFTDENGNVIKDIVGYRIFRGDRNNNRSVLARGLFSNTREYKEKDQIVKYTNYPYNPLTPDLYLSESQTYNKQSGEHGYKALSKVNEDEFTFFGPHSYFDRVGFGDYIEFDSAEKGEVRGYFEEVYKHPKAKLLSNNAIIYALIIGALDGYMRAFVGTRCEVKVEDGIVVVNTASVGPPPKAITQTTTTKGVKETSKCNDILKSVANMNVGLFGLKNVTDNALMTAFKYTIASGAFLYYTAETANKVLDIIYNIVGWRQYAAQYNSAATFNKSTPIKIENKRRKLTNYQYLSSELNELDGLENTKYNNLYKEDNVYVKLASKVETLSGDTSMLDMKKSNSCGLFKETVKSNAIMYYGTVKRTYPNQYGQLDSIRYVGTGDCIQKGSVSNIIYGGDCYINQFSVNNPTEFFTHPMFNLPDGFSYDYRSHRAIAYPRTWIDTTHFDIMDMIPKSKSSVKGFISARESNLPMQKYNLNCTGKKGFSEISKQYFYTSVNSVFNFIVESDYNLDLRDWKENIPNFYSKNSNLSKLFENRGEARQYEEFIYDKSYSKQITEEKFYQQDINYKQSTEKYYSYDKNKVAYSLPAFKEQKYNNWTNFLPNNYYSFSASKFGGLTAIHLIDNQQLIFLFDKSSPLITPGRSEIKTTDNQTVFLGDGTMIREPRPLVVTDDGYGNCQSRFAFNHNKFGFLYPSQRKGNIFNYTTNLDEVSRDGLFYWCDKYMPSVLLKQFPEFKDKDNPSVGVGMLSTYDPSFETYYLTKKDYSLKDEFIGKIVYKSSSNTFTLDNKIISLTDTTYFEDASWTLSYNPSIKGFVSFHDYQPNAYINTENHFLSIINKDGKSKAYKHNERCDMFSNFYGTDFPHAFALPVNNGQSVEILKSVEYQAETFLYKNNCYDKFHVLDTTYDKALIYNTEQITGWLNLNIKSKKDMSKLLIFESNNDTSTGFKIFVDKSEQKYRFNQFFDIVKDRGEFTQIKEQLLKYDASGYKFKINPYSIDYKKDIYQRKKIRHTHSNVYLERSVSGANKHIFYLLNSKQTNSPR